MNNPLIAVDKIVNEKVESMIDSGAIAKMIEDRIENTINEVVESELKSYSDFGKNLKEYINKTLQVNFDKLGFEGYHENLLRVIGKVYENSMQSVHLDKVKKLTEEMLANPPEVVKLSELVEAIKEKAIEDAQENVENDEHEAIEHDSNITCIVKDENLFTYIFLDPKEDVSQYSCSFRIGIYKGNKGPEFFSVSLNGKDSDNIFIQETYGLERLLFKAKCASSKFEFDIDFSEIDTGYTAEIEPSCVC